MFVIDGTQWPYPVDITRVSEVRPSEVSGMMLDGSYYNDVLGTFMQYTVKIVVPLNQRDAYTALYEILNAPVEGHTFVLPYNQGVINITGRIENVSDVYVRLPNGELAWRGIQFDVASNHPTKALTASQIVSNGYGYVPPIAAHNTGDPWVWDNDRWEIYTIGEDVNDKYF